MPTNYEAKATAANKANATLLAALTGLTVTVDRHGMAKMNANLLVEMLTTTREYEIRDCNIEGIVYLDAETERMTLADMLQNLEEDEVARVAAMYIGQKIVLYDGVAACHLITRLS